MAEEIARYMQPWSSQHHKNYTNPAGAMSSTDDFHDRRNAVALYFVLASDERQ